MALHSPLREATLVRLNNRASEIAHNTMQSVIAEHGRDAPVRPGETAIMLLLARQVALLEDIVERL